MGRVDFAEIRQFKEFPMEAIEKLGGQFLGYPGEEIRSSHISDKEGVSAKKSCRVLPAGTIKHDIGDVFGSVPGGFKNS
jgi:hypothetical protein